MSNIARSLATQKRQYNSYHKEIKQVAATLVSEQGYAIPQTAEAVGVSTHFLYTWKEHIEQEQAAQLAG
ncbi:transposase [Pseudoalteromonas sp. McH1-42]|uniref:transposase n=1 Tax=Pseudoalteromonas sp. McH1-42 TaxID=2917752 RepID=UPI001EF5081F|nr:transposase [Pseudoalteromonas sp. McH1-42]MCG7563271.1 transposase [Pseudoalteromonas sp. McH1-42]